MGGFQSHFSEIENPGEGQVGEDLLSLRYACAG